MALLVAATLGITSLAFYQFVQKPRVALVVSIFATQIAGITAAIAALPPAERDRFLSSLETLSQGGIALDDPAGWVIEAPEPVLVQMFLEQLSRQLPGQKIAFTPAPDSQLWIEIVIPGEDVRWLRMSLKRYIMLPAGVIVASILALMALVLGGTQWLLGSFGKRLRPLAAAIDSLGHVSRPPTDAGAPPPGRNDMGAELLSKFNDMSQRLAQAEAERTLMLAGVSHDLRSILTRLRLGLVLIDEGEVHSRPLIVHIHEMNRLIDQFLDFAQSPESTGEVLMDLSEVVSTVVAEFESEGLAISYTADPAPMTRLCPLAVRRLLNNLIDNALRHAGGTVEVRTDLADGFVRLQVLDRGPGVGQPELGRLLQPFFRTDDARARCSGSGLGLAIAQRIAVSHGGFLRVSLRDGGGLCVAAGFPVCALPVTGPQAGLRLRAL